MNKKTDGFSISHSSDVQVVQGDGNRTAKGDNSLTVQGDGNQALQGNMNSVSQGTRLPEKEPAELTQKEVISILEELERLISNSDLPEDIKSETASYLGAARKATEKEEPKKQTAIVNLESVAETLENASKTMDAGKNIWTQTKPIIFKVATWLGAIAAGSFLGTL